MKFYGNSFEKGNHNYPQKLGGAVKIDSCTNIEALFNCATVISFRLIAWNKMYWIIMFIKWLHIEFEHPHSEI